MTRDESIALFLQGREAWNAWAEARLKEKKALEAAGRWQVDDYGKGQNDETRAWIAAATINLSGLLFVTRALAHAAEQQAGHNKKLSPPSEADVKSILVEGDVIDFSGFIFPWQARFEDAQFHGEAVFWEAQFHGGAGFGRAQFHGAARFVRAQFHGEAGFGEAQFHGWAGFRRAQFHGGAGFQRAQFHGEAGFGEAQFHGWAVFRRAQFHGAGFEDAQFHGGAGFEDAQFHGWAGFGRAQFHGEAGFWSAQFHGEAGFWSAQFHGKAGFRRAQFHGGAGFERAQFHGEAGFGEAQFHGGAGFGRAQFHGEAGFGEAQFHRGAGFGEAQFHEEAVFWSAQFHGEAGFGGAQFHGEARFWSAQFHRGAGFGEAQFHRGAGFGEAQFHGAAMFWSAQFHGAAGFGRAQFHGAAVFGRAQFHGEAVFGRAQFHGEAGFESAQFHGTAGFADATFKASTSFVKARFGDRTNPWSAIFTGIKVERAFDMTGAAFSEVPAFNQADFAQAPDLDDVRYPHPPFFRFWVRGWADEEKTVRRADQLKAYAAKYRHLRRLAILGHDHENEAKAFKGETRAKRGTEHKPWLAAYWFGVFYDAFSDFGRSMMRPFYAWAALTAVFAAFYLATSGAPSLWACAPAAEGLKAGITALGEAAYLAVKNGLIVIGLGSEGKINQAHACLYGGTVGAPVFPSGISIWQIVQNLLSAPIIFLFLLGVRNNFKIK